MIIKAVCPTRLSLFGGGTDLPEYSDNYGGLVVNMAINIYQTVVMFSETDVFKCRGPQSGHWFPVGANPEFYYKILEEFNLNNSTHLTRLNCEFEGIIESGIGSSASVAVALIGGISKRLNLNMSLEEISVKAWEIEVDKIGLYGGKQDQYAAAFGGVNAIEFRKDKIEITPLAKTFIEQLLPSVVLFYTKSNRKSAKIQEGFRALSKQQIKTLDSIKQIALDSITPIGEGDVQAVGELLDKAWILKKESNKGVSNQEIDTIYEKAKKAGALGGKICGAGGGGFMLFIVLPVKREAFIKEMEKEGLQWWDFDIDWNGLKVRVLNDYKYTD